MPVAEGLAGTRVDERDARVRGGTGKGVGDREGGDAGLARVGETRTQGGVGESHQVLLASVTVKGIGNVADFLLGQQAIDGFERHLVVLRKRFRE